MLKIPLQEEFSQFSLSPAWQSQRRLPRPNEP